MSCFVSERLLLHFRCELSDSFVFDMGWNLRWGCAERGCLIFSRLLFAYTSLTYFFIFLFFNWPRDLFKITPSYLRSVLALIGSACRGRMVRRCLIRVLLKMEVVGSSATLTHIYQSTRHRILGHSDLHAT